MGGPGHRDVLVRREQLAGHAVEHVEEAVLRRLHQHLARLAVDRQVREHDVLRGGVVPVVAGRGLVVPDVVAGVGVQRDDRRQVQVVAAARAADVARSTASRCRCRRRAGRAPGRRRSRPRPCRPAADFHHSPFQVFAAFVEFGRARSRPCGIAGHRVEAPGELAGLGVVGGDVAAHAVLAAAVADQHLALHDARRAGDAVGLGAVDRVCTSQTLRAGLRVERDEPAVERADVDRALPDRDAAVDHVAAQRYGPTRAAPRDRTSTARGRSSRRAPTRRSTCRSCTSRRRRRSGSPPGRAACPWRRTTRGRGRRRWRR